MSERLEKIAGIISWIQNTSGYNVTFGDVAMEFGPNIGGHSIHDKKGRFIKYSDDAVKPIIKAFFIMSDI